ncbi:hypothetical protein YQE_06834, partial [Dendroctonus ponderosae]
MYCFDDTSRKFVVFPKRNINVGITPFARSVFRKKAKIRTGFSVYLPGLLKIRVDRTSKRPPNYLVGYIRA